MKVTFLDGIERDVYPPRPDILIIEPFVFGSMTNSGIILADETEGYAPITGTVVELPLDMSYLAKYYPNEEYPMIGHQVLFPRCSDEEFAEYYAWEDQLRVNWSLTYTGISVAEATKTEKIYAHHRLHLIHVDAIEAIIEP